MALQGSNDGIVRGTDWTHTLKELVNGYAEADTSTRIWERKRDEAMGPIMSIGFISSLKRKEKSSQGISKRERDGLRLRIADDEWIGEAGKVNRSIAAVLGFLQSIRRSYLSIENSSARRSESSRKDENDPLQYWKGVASLTDKERDEIEFQVKVMIKRCLGRIKELEKGEEGRSHPLYAEQLSQHRSAIIQYLSKSLTQANGRLGDMQEARLRAQQRRRLNLAGSAAAASQSNGMTSGKSALVAGSVGTKANRKVGATMPEEELTGQAVQDNFSASDLTPQQVQQFEQESSALIKSLSEDLSAIEAAERKLSEISEMQTQLIQHLGSQAEVADHLNQEAIGHTLEVGRGNEQLQKAKDNNRQASRFLCMFLVGSGIGLLFLHWMD